MKTVLAFGTFDILHPGHISYLKQAKSLGDRLVVIVATDGNVMKIKGKSPTQGQGDRLAIIRELRFVDDAFVGFEDDMIKSVEKINPDIVALGYDQMPSEQELDGKLRARGINAKIVRLKASNELEHKSAKIKEKIRNSKME